MDLRNLAPKLIGFIAIVITISLAPSIYSANVAVVNYGGGSGLVPFLGMDAIAPFGGFLAIFGLLATQGIFAIGTLKSGQGTGWRQIMLMIGLVIMTLIFLKVFTAAILPKFGALISSASVAHDDIGETVFGVVVIVIYLGIILGASVTNAVSEYKRRKKSRGSSRGVNVAYA